MSKKNISLYKLLDSTAYNARKKTKFKFNETLTLEKIFKNHKDGKKNILIYDVLDNTDGGVEILALYRTYEYFKLTVLYHKHPDVKPSSIRGGYKGYFLFLEKEFNKYWGKAGSTPYRDGSNTLRYRSGYDLFLDYIDAVSYTHLTLPTTPYV